MTETERERHRLAILDAAIPDWRKRAERYDAHPITLRLIDVDGALIVRAHVTRDDDRAPLLNAIRNELGATTPVHFTR